MDLIDHEPNGATVDAAEADMIAGAMQAQADGRAMSAMQRTAAEAQLRQLVVYNPIDQRQLLVPEAHQWDFARSPSATTYMAGGWGSGKSWALLLWLMVSAYYNPPNTSGAVVFPIERLLLEFVNQTLRPAVGHMIVNYRRNPWEIYFRGGRRLVLLSGFVPDRLESYTLCYVGMDEAGLMSPEILSKAWGRIRDPRATWARVGLVGVPLWGWLRDVFAGHHNRIRRIMHVSTEANLHNLRAETARDLRRNVPASQLDCFLHGLFVPPGDRVYHEYDPAVHAVDLSDWHPFVRLWNQQTAPANIGCVIDPSARSPHAIVVQLLPRGAVRPWELVTVKRPEGEAVILDEHHPGGDGVAITTEQLCREVKAKGWPISWVVMDPAGNQAKSTGMSDVAQAQEVFRVDVQFETDSDLRLIPNGVNMVRRMLRPLEGDPFLWINHQLTMNPHPRGTHNSFMAYSYSPTKYGRAIDERPVKDGITDHAMDTVRYLAINFFPVVGHRVRSHYVG